jgi:PAS domain-containing protein
MAPEDMLRTELKGDSGLEYLSRDELLSLVRELKSENASLRREQEELLEDAKFMCNDEVRKTELLKQEKYMKLLLESSPEVILLLDGVGRIEYCSNSLLRLSNIQDSADIIGRPFHELYAMFGGPDFVEEGVRRFEKVRAHRRASEANVLIDFSGRGESRMYNVQAAPMLDEDGSFDGVKETAYVHKIM